MTASRPKQQRGTPLVDKVLDAALEEIARFGQEKLSIEGVAARAGVNKTTIWRRWPTAEALAIAAFAHASDSAHLPDTGSLRGDLIEYVTRVHRVSRSPAMLSLLRLRYRDTAHDALGTLLAERFARADAASLTMFRRAVARGELPGDADVELLGDLLLAGTHRLILVHPDQHLEDRLARMIDVLVHGATNVPQGRGSSGRPGM